MANYRKGAQFERDRVQYHYDRGAVLAFRAAGSHGKIDVVAVYPEETVLEQLKVTQHMYKAQFKKELVELGELQSKLKAFQQCLLVVKQNRDKVYEIIPPPLCSEPQKA
jgi:Holliday junction resolvase